MSSIVMDVSAMLVAMTIFVTPSFGFLQRESLQITTANITHLFHTVEILVCKLKAKLAW